MMNMINALFERIHVNLNEPWTL